MTNPPPQNPTSSIITIPEEERNAFSYMTLLATRVLLKCNPELRLDPSQLVCSAQRVVERILVGIVLPADFYLRDDQVESLAEEICTLLIAKFGKRRVQIAVMHLNPGEVEDEMVKSIQNEMVKAIQERILDLTGATDEKRSCKASVCRMLAIVSFPISLLMLLFKISKLFQ